MSARVEIASIGVLASGLESWPATRAVLSGAMAFVPADVAPKPSEQLAAAERRRLNANARWALAAASEALAAVPDVARDKLSCVFASADGDGDILEQILAALVLSPVVMSPTLFHNSVFNAAAGYCSIAHHLSGPSTTLCACEFTFAAALLEACDQVVIDGVPVLCVVVDTAYPRSLANMRASVPSFACALLLRPLHAGSSLLGSIAIEPPALVSPARSTAATPSNEWSRYWSGDTAAAALPLLNVIAHGRPASLDLAQAAVGRLFIDYRP